MMPSEQTHVSPPATEADVAVETATVVTEVAQVDEQLEAHSIASEERHDEILEETQQCQNQTEQLSGQLIALQTTLTVSLTAMQSELSLIRSELATIPKSLPVSQPPIQETQTEEAPPIAMEVPSAEVGPEEAATFVAPKKRRLI